AFLISIIACAASRVGTATRTTRQSASLRRAISFRVAFTFRVSALVIDCTTISAAPPITTSPTRTGTDLRRALISTHRYMSQVQSDQTREQGQRNAPPALGPGPPAGLESARAREKQPGRRRAPEKAGCWQAPGSGSGGPRRQPPKESPSAPPSPSSSRCQPVPRVGVDRAGPADPGGSPLAG